MKGGIVTRTSWVDTFMTLTGRVSSWLERAEAERAAWSALGATSVINRITMEPRQGTPGDGKDQQMGDNGHAYANPTPVKADLLLKDIEVAVAHLHAILGRVMTCR